MESNGATEVQRHLKVYVGVFIALLVFTLLTVAASQLALGTAGHVTIALIIAAIKAGLVAGFFMHLVSEKGTIYGILVFAMIFFIGLMFLTLYSMADTVVIKNVA